jgi:hypothetical protein
MPHPVTVTAEGTTLCTLARAAGFENCQRLRDEPANADFLNRDLRINEVVTIPDAVVAQENKADSKEHVFEAPGIPLPDVRFVRGKPDTTDAANDPATDDALTFLNISNFRSDKCGSAGTTAFPNAFGYSADAKADPDTFKIELVGLGASVNTANVTLEALKPEYGRDPAPIGWAPFPNSDANAGMRRITVACQKLTNWNRLQSRYLRLVTDEGDMNAISGNPARTDGTAQGLLVSDLADGNDSNNDRVEILDQKVRVSYEIGDCPAPSGQQKCTIRKTVEVGPNRKHLKVAFHVFRESVGGSVIGSLTAEMIRKRVRKWLRRLYAQAELSPKFVDPIIEFLDPPGATMLVISDRTGQACSGVNSSGAVSAITIDLEIAPPPSSTGSGGTGGSGSGAPAPSAPSGSAGASGGAPAAPAEGTNTLIVQLTPNLTPSQIGERIRTTVALTDHYRADCFENAVCIGQANRSCDVLFTRDDNQRFVIRSATTDDTSLTGQLVVPRISMSTVAAPAPFNDMPAQNPEARRILRESPGADDQLDFYIIGTFVTTGTGAYAMSPYTDWPAANHPLSPIPYSVIIAALSGGGGNMDASDQFFSMLAHEGGHALLDQFHTDSHDPLYTESLMYNYENSTDTPDVNKRKRLHDTPLSVQTELPKSTSPFYEVAAAVPAQRIRTRSATCLDNW